MEFQANDKLASDSGTGSRSGLEFYNYVKSEWNSETRENITVIKDSIKKLSPSCIHLLLKESQSERKFSCKIISYKYGIFRIIFDDENETKYKNITKIGENLVEQPFPDFIYEEDRVILESIDNEDLKLDLDIKISCIGHNLNTKCKNQTSKLEIITSPNFVINYYYQNQLISSLNKYNRFTQLKGKKFNPNSIDITAYSIKSIHGLPERLSKFSLEDDSYRLYNLDVFDQVVGDSKSLYGSIPMLHHIGEAGENKYMFTVFVNNCSETWVDIETLSGSEKVSTWTTEGGVLDIYLYADTNFHKSFYKTGKITGFAPLAPLFSLGYHHCRWGFTSQEDITEVDDKMTQMEIPYDVLWLDIDHTDRKHYFTWDKENFPDMESFVKQMKNKGRHLVTIIDPHISTHEEYEIATTLKCLVSNNTLLCESKLQLCDIDSNLLSENLIETEDISSHFVGHCWPGSSFYADFINYEQILPVWNKFFKNENYFLNSDIIHTWIDMNEPSVFNQPEATMPKDCLHFDGVSNVPHYEVHNIYGHNYHRVTYDSLKNRYDGKIRPFVLSRSFYAGSQQFGFIWTGDNKSSWEFMKISIDMIMSISFCGFSACGADVGGFFGDPDEELLSSWYDLGVFYPFFRGHSHNEAKRREPWNFSEFTQNSIKNSIKLRYNLLLFIYTKFFEYTLTGIPICKPLWLRFPLSICSDEISSNMIFGDEFIVVPFLNTEKKIELDFEHYKFYEFFTGRLLDKNLLEKSIKKDTKDKKLTLLIVAGSVIPWTDTIDYSSKSVLENPVSIKIFPDVNNSAKGNLYLDDGKSFNYRNGDYVFMNINYSNHELRIKSNKIIESPISFIPISLNEIKIFGYGSIVKEGIKSVRLTLENEGEEGKSSILLDWKISSSTLIITNLYALKIQISSELKITLEY